LHLDVAGLIKFDLVANGSPEDADIVGAGSGLGVATVPEETGPYPVTLGTLLHPDLVTDDRQTVQAILGPRERSGWPTPIGETARIIKA
jgi:hypothetical protein